MLPLAPGDQKLEKIDLISRDRSHVDFMRPTAESNLGKQGAGKDDPSLPTYIGAVPPKGVSPWDWNDLAGASSEIGKGFRLHQSTNRQAGIRIICPRPS